MPDMEIKKVWHDVFRIKETFYKESANLYLILGNNKNLLIDTGIGICNIKKEIAGICHGEIMALNTHCHFDHSGGNKFFSETFIHASEKKCLENTDKDSTASFLLKNDDFIQEIDGFDASKYKVEPPKAIKILKNNQKIKIGDFILKILHTPGHSTGSVCLYEPDKKILFSGDVIYDGKLLFDLPFSNPKAYIKSLKQLSNLEVNKCFPGHNNVLNKTEFYAILKNAIDTIEKRAL